MYMVENKLVYWCDNTLCICRSVQEANLYAAYFKGKVAHKLSLLLRQISLLSLVTMCHTSTCIILWLYCSPLAHNWSHRLATALCWRRQCLCILSSVMSLRVLRSPSVPTWSTLPSPSRTTGVVDSERLCPSMFVCLCYLLHQGAKK